MKKYVWSETVVEGGKPFHGNAGSSAVEHRSLSEHGRSRCSWPRRQGAPPPPQFYADAAVIAYRRAGQRCAGGIAASEDDGECGRS